MKQYQRKELPFNEFIIMMALMMSIVALSIDAILPALQVMAIELHSPSPKDAQHFIVAVFVGLALGQLLFGPLSDSIGRRLSIVAGYSVFIVGSIMAMTATDHDMMVFSRFLQGFGIAAPRVISVAIIRDLYQGRAMARVMSFIMMIFVLVPMLAPLFGQLILTLVNWQSIFFAILVVGLISLSWYLIRQEETLKAENRAKFSASAMLAAIGSILKNRRSIGYTISAGIISGPFVFYLSSASQLFTETYQLGQWFPLYFAGLTLAFGVSSYINGKNVMKYGMRYIVRIALIAISMIAALFVVVTINFGGYPPLALTTLYMLATFFSLAMIFGNINALAMEPLGESAGLGSAIVGSVSTIISALLAFAIGAFFDGSVFPLVISFGLAGLSTLILTWWIDTDKEMAMEDIPSA
ncbi:multidrug effflux MFS transporter [Vibrio sp. VB16]|uniref:multidrug effflux MFS transporter n=1 Tax=Vibrio sp. VB16 TaxID=2785746 RepID=UPI00189E5807|nr:multidrug effflux MFS transporter [Vibrio sp. VB16]UGA57325.1 multidrug effflux MFS transporter [Vibrio sp. VB16]